MPPNLVWGIGSFSFPFEQTCRNARTCLVVSPAASRLLFTFKACEIQVVVEKQHSNPLVYLEKHKLRLSSTSFNLANVHTTPLETRCSGPTSPSPESGYRAVDILAKYSSTRALCSTIVTGSSCDWVCPAQQIRACVVWSANAHQCNHWQAMGQ